MSGEQFSLVWNSFPTNLSSGLYSLLTDEHLVDVTLTAEGQILRAHKLILSVCSSYFRELFKGNNCKHPIVILKDVNYRDLSAMLHFMYQGEVNIKQEDISSFLELAETLQIKGLTKEKHMSETLEKDKTASLLKKEAPDIEENRESTESPENVEDQLESPLQSVNSSSNRNENSFVKLTTRKKFYDNIETESQTENTMRSINNIINDNYVNQNDSPMIEETTDEIDEPLDFTREMRENFRDNNTEEPLNYGLNVDESCKNLTVPNNEQLSYSQDYQKESLGVNSGQENRSKDLSNDAGLNNNGKGKRTVRGLPESCLPLETTLRVVSELGPTLRVERGKVVRMYSCPWCLRHFTRKENLKLHVRYIHGPLESLTCKLCGNKYKNSNSLRVHSYLYHNAKRNKRTKPQIGGNI